MKSSVKILTGSVVCIILAASFLFLSGPNLDLLFATEVPFEVIESGGMGSGFEERANLTIRTRAEWQSLWTEIHSGDVPIPDVPSVNFTSEMIFAVFQGYCGSSGYSSTITRIVTTGTYYVVYVDEMHPGEGCVVLPVITYPYHIVKITGYPLNLPVQFVFNITVYTCE